MFIGREKELTRLERMYSSDKFEFAIVYGRRRVGKTTMITHFLENKKNIFFACQKASKKDNLEELSKQISSILDYGVSFNSFIEAFRAIIKLSQKERIVLVLDEFPYLAKQDNNEVSSILQNLIDHEGKSSKLFLFICGSSLSFMEDQVLGKESPLYGRATGIFKIEPFDYYQSGKFTPNYTPEEKAIVYGVTGGIARYLELFDDRLSIKENLLYNFFDSNSILFNEKENYLKEEFTEVSTYNSILSSIANGKTKLAEIANQSGIQIGTLPKYLTKLKEVGIIKKITPIGEKTTKGVWVISDLFFRFWFFFVSKNISTITASRMDEHYELIIEPYINDYMGKVFEKIVSEYIERYAKLPFPIREIGTWWGGSKKLKKEIEIDIVTLSAINENAIISSVKFRNKKLSVAELELMKQYAYEMNDKYNYDYWFFSKSGFEEDFLKKESEDIKLFTIENLYALDT